MPIYEYQCRKCGRIHEAIQKFSDKPLKSCSHCSGPLHKLISQSSFHLKGSGWYVTDYVKKPEKSTSPAKSETDTSDTATPSADKSPPAKSASDDKQS